MDHESCFFLNTIPILLSRQLQRKTKGFFKAARMHVDTYDLFQTLECSTDIMCQLHCILTTPLTKGEYVMPCGVLGQCSNVSHEGATLGKHTQKKVYMRKMWTITFYTLLKGGSFCAKFHKLTCFSPLKPQCNHDSIQLGLQMHLLLKADQS